MPLVRQGDDALLAKQVSGRLRGNMVIAIVPILLCVVGALVYALSSNGKLQELGRLLFAAGAFALAFSYASRTVGI